MHAPQNEKQQFVDYIFGTFDPNFYSEEDLITNQTTVYQFMEDCELTLNEMIRAVKMVLNGQLTNEKSEQIEIRHKISLISLYEIKRAYIRYKQADYQHTKGIKMISQMKEEPQQKPLSDEDKVMLFFTSLMTDFDNFKANKKITLFASQHYYPLYYLGVLPKHDEAFREQINVRVTEALKKDFAQTDNRLERDFLKQIIESQMTNEGRFKSKAHELIVSDFFQKLVDEGKSISDVLKEKTAGKTHSQIVEMIRY